MIKRRIIASLLLTMTPSIGAMGFNASDFEVPTPDAVIEEPAYDPTDLGLYDSLDWYEVSQPCATEDSTGPCYWDAAVQGNGYGRSFIVTAEQETIFFGEEEVLPYADFPDCETPDGPGPCYMEEHPGGYYDGPYVILEDGSIIVF